MLLIPVIAAVQFLFTMALGILLSSLNAFFRDIQNVLRHVLRLWFYLSPALYSLSLVAEGNQIDLHLLDSTRSRCSSSRIGRSSGARADGGVFLPPGPPDWIGLAVLTGLFRAAPARSAILVFKRAEPAFARIL